MPLSLILAFKYDYGVVGLWSGCSIAVVILDIGFFFIIVCCNWEAIGEKVAS
jgi:hypothetical protein